MKVGGILLTIFLEHILLNLIIRKLLLPPAPVDPVQGTTPSPPPSPSAVLDESGGFCPAPPFSLSFDDHSSFFPPSSSLSSSLSSSISLSPPTQQELEQLDILFSAFSKQIMKALNVNPSPPSPPSSPSSTPSSPSSFSSSTPSSPTSSPSQTEENGKEEEEEKDDDFFVSPSCLSHITSLVTIFFSSLSPPSLLSIQSHLTAPPSISTPQNKQKMMFLSAVNIGQTLLKIGSISVPKAPTFCFEGGGEDGEVWEGGFSDQDLDYLVDLVCFFFLFDDLYFATSLSIIIRILTLNYFSNRLLLSIPIAQQSSKKHNNHNKNKN